jgi:hypothetical protein
MQGYRRLTGLEGALPNALSKDIRLIFKTPKSSLLCIARYGVAAQIAAGLGIATRMLRMAMAVEGAAAESISETHVVKNLLSDSVLVVLATPQGIPYTFDIPSQTAIDISEKLRTEATRSHPPTGSA